MARKTLQHDGSVYLLSGTPMPNDPTELWPPVKYLWPEIAEQHECSSKRQWMHEFCRVRITPYGWKPYAVKNGAALRKSLDKIMLRRTLDDVALELPPLRVDLQRLPKSQAAENALAEYEEWEETDYTSTIRRLLGSLKAPIIVRQLVEELSNGAYEKLVVFYHHKDVGYTVDKAFEDAGFSVAGFGGDASSTEREEQIQRFQANDDVRVFVGQQTAAGIGVNLTAANEVVLLEPAWTPSDNEQALKRIHRIGQDKPCRVRIFALSGTIDEAIMGTIRNKVKMQKEVGL